MALATEVFRSSSDIAASRLRRGWPVRRLLLVVTIVCAGLLSGCGLDLIYVDWRVNQLCEIDGGVRTRQTDDPPKEFLKPDGNVDLVALQRAKPGQTYYINMPFTTITILETQVKRLESQLIRHHDNAILSTSIVYVRPGRNVGVPLLHRQGYTCPNVNELDDMVTQTFFSKQSRN